MNRSLLFYRDGAEELNALVQERIAPHLFLLCNYEPDSVRIFGDDGRFLKGVANLYKFVVDAGLIGRLKRLDGKLGGSLGRKCRDVFGNLQDCQALVQDLRTNFAHNVSEESGTGDVRRRAQQWLRNAIQKEEPTQAEDYQPAVEALEKLAERVYSLASTLVDELSQAYEKEELIRQWEGLILEFYDSSTNRNIAEGQLKLAFRARFPDAADNLDWKIAGWCKGRYLKKDEKELEDARTEYDKFQDQIPVSTRTDMEKWIEEIEGRIRKTRETIALKYCDGQVERLRDYHYKDYYLSSLKTKYTQQLPQLKAKGYTMLPQDMMQYIMEEDFGKG